MTRIHRRVALALLLVLVACVGAVQAGEQAQDDPRLDWWRDARFGLFLHWGLYAIPAGRWGEETDHAEWIRTTAQIPVDEYAKLKERFHPTSFDADAWCRMAAAAGMRYVVVTSKHHDGFCLWDSKATDFDVMATPFGRDVLRELSAACARHGLKLCFYHSIMDWHHPDYLPRRGWERASRPAADADFARYVRFLRSQVTELLTNYGDVGILWFDGQWEATWSHEHGQALYDLCRKLQPDVIVNDRVDVGRLGQSGCIAEGCAGDYGTPEQHVPEGQLHGVDWETCLTMNRHWGWNEADQAWKSPTELVRTLVDVASRNGNLLLNVGPKPDGTFPDQAVRRLAAIGTWMDVNAPSIRGTTSSSFPQPAWGRLTEKRHAEGTTLYLHVFDWPADRRLVLRGVGNAVRAARLLAAPSTSLPTTREALDLVIAVPRASPDERCAVVELELEGPPLVFRPPAFAAAAHVFVDRVEVGLVPPEGTEARYTLDGSEPSSSSPRYEGPIPLTATTTVKAATWHGGRRVSRTVSQRLEKVTPRGAVEVEGTKPGLLSARYRGDWDALPDLHVLAPQWRGVATTIDLGRDAELEHVARVFEGYLDVPDAGVYVFELASDDGSRLELHGETAIDLDGLHGIVERRAVVPLARGLHPIRVAWFNKTGGATLRLRWARAGAVPAPIAPSHLFHDPQGP